MYKPPTFFLINSRHQGILSVFYSDFYVPSTSIVRKYGILTKGDKTFWTTPPRHISYTFLHHITLFHGTKVLAAGKIRYKSRIVYHFTQHSRFPTQPKVESLFYYPFLSSFILHPPPSNYTHQTTIVTLYY